jgi:hypothetical protein
MHADSPNVVTATPSTFPWQQMMPFMMPGMFQAMAATATAPVVTEKPFAHPIPL